MFSDVLSSHNFMKQNENSAQVILPEDEIDVSYEPKMQFNN